MLSCIGFPECRAVQYFPGFVSDAVPHESRCSKVDRKRERERERERWGRGGGEGERGTQGRERLTRYIVHVHVCKNVHGSKFHFIHACLIRESVGMVEYIIIHTCIHFMLI